MFTPVWIFQATPQRFDFDGFLKARPRTCKWLVTERNADKIMRGDDVILWRAKGTDPIGAGAVALAEVTGDVEKQPDDSPSGPYWVDRRDETDVVYRVSIRLVDIRAKPLEYDELRADPALENMTIFTLRTGSNFPLTEAEARRLASLW